MRDFVRVKCRRRGFCNGRSHVNDQARRMGKREVLIGPERCARKRHGDSMGRQLSDYKGRWDGPTPGLGLGRPAEPGVGKSDHHATWIGGSLLNDRGVTIEIQHQSGSLRTRHHTEIANSNGGYGSSRSSDGAVFRCHHRQRTVILRGPSPSRLDQDSRGGQEEDGSGREEGEGLD